MRIGILSDIHGNLPALEAVLADMERRGVDRVVNLGDVAFRGPFPAECTVRVRQMGAPVILGNTEVWLTEAEPKLPEALLAVRAWTRERMAPADLDWLAALPAEFRLEVAGQRLLFAHGSPRSNMEFLFPFTPEADLKAALAASAADVVVVGHTHWAFSRRIGQVHLIGAGSIGLPFDGDPRAAYAILEVTERSVGVTHVRVAYDQERTVAAARESGFPDLGFLEYTVRKGQRPE